MITQKPLSNLQLELLKLYSIPLSEIELLVTLPTHSPYRLIFDKLVAGAYDLVISNDILTEYEEQISKRYDAQTVEELFLVLLMLSNVQRVTPYFRWRLIINDPDDDKFVDAAIVANVEYLVTDDRF